MTSMEFPSLMYSIIKCVANSSVTETARIYQNIVVTFKYSVYEGLICQSTKVYLCKCLRVHEWNSNTVLSTAIFVQWQD